MCQCMSSALVAGVCGVCWLGVASVLKIPANCPRTPVGAYRITREASFPKHEH